MNLNAQQTRIAGFALIAFAVVMILDLWWLLPVAMLGGAGVAIYRRERSIGQINSAVQGGLWGLGLAVLYVLGAIFPGVLLLGGASLLLRGNEAKVDAKVQEIIERRRARRSFQASSVTPPVAQPPVTVEQPRNPNETIRL